MNASCGKSDYIEAGEQLTNGDQRGRTKEYSRMSLLCGLPVSRRRAPRGGRGGCAHPGGPQTGLDSSDQPGGAQC